jgi:hypothetical protein
MFAGLKRAAGAKRGRGPVHLKSAPKSENKTYHHFTPKKGQSSARISPGLLPQILKIPSNQPYFGYESTTKVLAQTHHNFEKNQSESARTGEWLK